jgi:TfoX/Sxy family transcriptional regulator of competence genes
MRWRPSPPDLVATFTDIVPGPPAVQRKMFGYPAAFVNGNMFMGLFEDRLILRLAEDSREQLLSVKGASPFEPMPGRPMREYVVVPPAILEARKKLATWVDRALAYGASLPPKASAVKSKGTRPKPKKRARG